MADINSAPTSGFNKDAIKNREIQEAIKHITSLSALSKEVPSILEAVGSAFEALSADPDEHKDDESEDRMDTNESLNSTSTIAERKAAFEKYTRQYFSIVKNVSQTLQSEIFALEEAKILPVETPKGPKSGAAIEGGSGMGQFDTGVLNSRAEDAALRRRRELLVQAREFLAKPTAVVEPVIVEPMAVEPTAVEPTAVEPAAVEPTAVELMAVEPTTVEPTAVEPTAVEPTDTVSLVVESTADESTLATRQVPL